MSNFICSECGMTNIDCGGARYKTPKEIELENQIADLSKKVERLQEQLEEAQHTIYCIANTDGSDCKTILETIIRDANLYLEKWGCKMTETIEIKTPKFSDDYVVSKTLYEEIKESRRNLWLKQQKVIALIKDGRFVEALQELEK